MTDFYFVYCDLFSSCESQFHVIIICYLRIYNCFINCEPYMIPNSFFKLVLSEIANANFCVDGGGVGKDHFILSEMRSRPPVYHPCCYL